MTKLHAKGIGVLIIVLLTWWRAPACGVTLADYERIEPAMMSYTQVVAMLGPPDAELSHTRVLDAVTALYQWHGANGANMVVLFQGHTASPDLYVVFKSQIGLR